MPPQQCDGLLDLVVQEVGFGGHWKSTRKGRSSFLKKRTKKLLFVEVYGRAGTAPKEKVFCFFFSKKKAFFLHCGAAQYSPPTPESTPVPLPCAGAAAALSG
jgi:hypothetical protein